ncbi:MAG TPA: hypothetical protein VMI92_01270 [Steroidobacteraceae bacterium]|nr:hypothetical protein [Steroidobacteraceae bacterium]
MKKHIALGLLLGAALPCAALAASSSAKLPDWSGAWSRVEGLEHPDPTKVLPYLKDEEAARFGKEIKDASFRVPWSFCDPPAFPAMMTEEPLPFEFLFTPGRVTLIMADDQVRRIYTDGRKHADDPDPAYFGDSVGKWEGDTLVVDTIGLRDDNDIVIGLEAGADTMHVVERIRLVKPDTLSDEIEISGLPMLKAPFKRTQLYKRDRKTPVTENLCVASKNRNTGSSVDLTPPPR